MLYPGHGAGNDWLGSREEGELDSLPVREERGFRSLAAAATSGQEKGGSPYPGAKPAAWCGIMFTIATSGFPRLRRSGAPWRESSPFLQHGGPVGDPRRLGNRRRLWRCRGRKLMI
jgi:hypothetical protein